MDAITAILTRRSIRSYNNKPISKKVINDLLKSAVSSPSAGNQQPWHFIIINNRNILKKITEFHPNAKFLINAKLAIMVCCDINLEKFKGYWMIDCSAATQNILIAARALGLGSCWIGIYPREERMISMKKILKTPENIIPFSLVSLGYTNEEQNSIDRLDSSRIHINYW